MDEKNIEEKLKDRGYKLTNQRKAIIYVLYTYKNHFLSAEEIFIKSKEKYPQMNFSTLYRNLEILENIGILHKTNIHGGTFSYGLICHSLHHHHIICKGCGKTESIDFCPLEKIKLHNNFILTDHKFELYGYCQRCQKTGVKID